MSAGSGGVPVAVAAALSGLVANTIYHYRLMATNQTGTTYGADRTFTTTAGGGGARPALSALRVSPKTVSIAGRKVNGRCVKPTAKNNLRPRCRLPVKLRITFTLNVPATVTFRLKRLAAGRRVNGRCVKPTARNSAHKLCTRKLTVPGKVTTIAKAGADKFIFSGRIGGHKLAPGRYRLTATPAAGARTGPPRTVAFRILG